MENVMRSGFLALALCSPLALTSCQSESGLSPQIQPANLSVYKTVLDAKNWANPYLIVRADGIEIISKTLKPNRQTVPVNQLKGVLLSLPTSAWSYGRVVALQQVGVRSGAAAEDKLIEQNQSKAMQILKSLKVKAELWPSA
jgi:hypothetical protein